MTDHQRRENVTSSQTLEKLLRILQPLNSAARALAGQSCETHVPKRRLEFGPPEIFDSAVDQYAAGVTLLVTSPSTHTELSSITEDRKTAPRAIVLPAIDNETTASVFADSSIPLFSKAPVASWSELNWLLSCLAQLHYSAVPDTEPVLIQKLMEAADLLAEQTGCSITVEDPQSNILAYSSAQSPEDEIRIQTILQRRVPEQRREELEDSGFFDLVWESPDPVDRPHIDGRPERLVMRIVHEGMPLGMIWAANPADQFDQNARVRLRTAAEDLVPLLLLWRRQTQVLQRIQERAASALFRSYSDSDRAEDILGIDRASELTVLKAVLAPSTSLEQLASLEFYAQRSFPGSVVNTQYQEHAVFIAVETTATSYQRLLTSAHTLRDTAAAVAGRLCVIIGDPHCGPGKAAASARTANEIEGLLRVKPGGILVHDVVDRYTLGHSIEILRAVKLLRSEGTDLLNLADPVRAYDAANHTDLFATLSAYLTCLGDYGKAAAKLNVHANTVRYRLRRIQEIADLNVDDPDSVLRWMLAVRAAELANAGL